jgi:hypothetical protein
VAENKGPQVSLSGYQPGRDASGLDLMAQPMYEAFMRALLENDQTGETLRFPVVGVLEARVGHIGRPGIEKEPSMELRFVAVEPVIDRDTIRPLSAAVSGLLGELNDAVGDGNEEAHKLLDLLHEALDVKPREQVVLLMHQLRDVRIGEQPIDGLELTTDPVEPAGEGEKPATGGEPTTRQPAHTGKARTTKRSGGEKVLTASFSSSE